MNYSEALKWLYGTQQHGIKPGLKGIQRLLDTLGVHGRDQRFIHVAGTNGKGSVCACLDSIGRAAGLRTGLFTSPHLISFRERIKLNGQMISETAVAKQLSVIADAIEKWDPHPTFFEITTALALDYFQREGADLVVLETGLGGRLDATNVITPVVSVITSIDLDHIAWLGSTLEAIAAEKGGIIKSSIPVLSSPQPESAARVLIKIAHEKNSAIEFITDELSVGLAGSHQKLNAALAVRALQSGGFQIAESAIQQGLKEVTWPGRFQRLNNNRLILDGAHNEAAAKRLTQTWREVFGNEQAVIILGILKDKDMESICHALQPIAKGFILVPVQNPRTSHPEELQAILHQINPDIDCKIASEFAHAITLAEASPERSLVTGSLFLIGEALAHFDKTGALQEMSSQ